MAARSCASPDALAALSPPAARPPSGPGCAACCRASRWSGTLVGEVIVVAAPGMKLNPVITPPVLTVTSAVACCHHGLLTERTGTTSPLRRMQSCLRRAFWAGFPGPCCALRPNAACSPPRLLTGCGQAVKDGLHPRIARVVGVLEKHSGLGGDL